MILAGHTWWGSGYPWAAPDPGRHRRSRRDRAPAPRPPDAPPPTAQRRRPAPCPATAPRRRPTQDPTYAAPPVYVEQPRPVNPRKKGPILFWFALAVMAVGSASSASSTWPAPSVAPSAYPALVLALSGVFLLLGAFWGRAGGLILVGLVAAGHRRCDRSATSGTRTARPSSRAWRRRCRAATRSTSASSSSTCPRSATRRRSTAARSPSPATSATSTSGSRPTSPSWPTPRHRGRGINAFDRDGGGDRHRPDRLPLGGPGAPRLTIDAELHVGGIDVHTEANAEGACHDARPPRPSPSGPSSVPGRPGGTRSTSATW